MGLGLLKAVNKIYLTLIMFRFSLRKFVFGFENASRMLQFVDKRAINAILRRNGAVVGEDCDIESPLIIHNCVNYRNLTIGKKCHIGKDVFLDLRKPIVIEDCVTISMRSTIVTHLDVGASRLREHGFSKVSKGTVLERDCYIGANSIILHGVTVGACAMVCAGAVVTKDVAPYTLVGGVPAKKIRKIKRMDYSLNG